MRVLQAREDEALGRRPELGQGRFREQAGNRLQDDSVGDESRFQLADAVGRCGGGFVVHRFGRWQHESITMTLLAGIRAFVDDLARKLVMAGLVIAALVGGWMYLVRDPTAAQRLQ